MSILSSRTTMLGGAAVASAAFLVAVATLSPAGAASGGNGNGKAPSVYKASVTQLNHSGARSSATILVRGDQLTVNLEGTGFAPNLPHAQHIHGAVAAANECPTSAADVDKDGFVNVLEGVPFYGPIASSLTVFGDTSPAAALNLELMPVADAAGRIDYHRTFTVDPAMAANITDFHIVQHGIDIDRSGAYDGSKLSELFPPSAQVPFEVTVPATCGEIVPAGHQH